MTLEISVLDVLPEPFAAVPTLIFRLRVTDDGAVPVSAIALRAQIQIQPQRRQYTDDEAALLTDQFGGRQRWRDTLRPFLWTHASTMVRGFTGDLEFDLPVPCTYDLEVTGTPYLHALRQGEIPLELLFSGTAFRPAGSSGGLGVEQIPWHLQATHQLPVAVWRALMDRFFPHAAWLRLDRDTVDALIRYRTERGLISSDAAVLQLLDGASAEAAAAGPTVGAAEAAR
ncbi:MAG TPA: DUF6084 family protein [Frankiaceae bacterium]|nr:DUF6084 family protein [Frankiaceae bacterium]